jgi:hypothetical protein
MKVRITFTDGRADRVFDTQAFASSEPFAWDGSIKARSLPAAEGYDGGASASMGASLSLRCDLLEGGGPLRIDACWANTLVCGRTKEVGFDRRDEKGNELKGFSAEEECGRSLVLADAWEVGHIGSVEVDGEPLLERMHGALCNIGRAAAARKRLEAERTEGLERLYGADLGPSAPRGADMACRTRLQACGLHELARWAHPELYLMGESEGHMPMWDEAALCAETGWPQEAWWRLAVSEWFRKDGFYHRLGRGLSMALTLYPAARWYRESVGGEVADAMAFFRTPETTPVFEDDYEHGEDDGAEGEAAPRLKFRVSAEEALEAVWDGDTYDEDLEKMWDERCAAQGLVPQDAYRPESDVVIVHEDEFELDAEEPGMRE